MMASVTETVVSPPCMTSDCGPHLLGVNTGHGATDAVSEVAEMDRNTFLTHLFVLYHVFCIICVCKL